MKRIRFHIDGRMDEALAKRARERRRSKASLIRDAVKRAYLNVEHDPPDEWVGGVDVVPGAIDDVVYRP